MRRLAKLAQARYVSIESYRVDGDPVRTPVWITAEGEKLFCWTMAHSGKVRRVRSDRRVRLAPCNARGDVLGDWVDCSARILDSRADIDAQKRRMRAKYGLLFLPFEWLPRLRRRTAVAIEFNAVE